MRIPIRSKLAGALLLPLLALVLVAGYEVSRASNQASDVRSEASLATAAVGPSSLISQLQNERNFAGVDQLGLSGALELSVTSTEQARSNTDQAIDGLRAFVEEGGADLEGVFDAGLAAVDAELAALRATIDASTAPKGLENQAFADELFIGYTEIIGILIADTGGIALEIDDAELRTGAELVSLSTLAFEGGSNVVRAILQKTITNDSSVEARLEVARLIAVTDQIDTELLDRSVGPYEGIAQEFLLTEQQDAQDELFNTFPTTGTADTAALADGIGATEDIGTLGLRNRVATVLQSQANELIDDANQQRTLALVLSGFVIAAAIVITALATRSITDPLRSLTRQAREMATVRLPTAVQNVLDTPLGDDVTVPDIPPIRVKTRDEVADVAAALNTVQGSALDLAVEQAVLRRNIADSFVNLGRRNQNLLDRQLDFITDLERDEEDAERLEGLFRLDHLATRMRRNAESLLRLAGGSTEATADWSGPVPIVDVVRGALGEVEGYQRVDVRALQAATVSGTAGADLAHAIAELVENALTFSPPSERVEIRGRRSDDGGYLLAIIDLGVGMSNEQLETANRRLAGKESFTVAPSRYLGHYVAGYLAAQHGIKIQLHATAAGGLTARVEIPPALLVSDTATGLAPEPAPQPAAPAVDDGWPQPAPAPVDEPDEQSWPQPAPAAEPAPTPSFDPPPAPEVRNPSAPTEPPPALPSRRLEPAGRAAPGDSGPVARTPAAPSPRPARSESQPVTGGTTASGLTRRVRGANAPTATNVAAAFGGGATGGTAAPEPAPAPDSTATADAVASFLSAFSGGVERGLAETTHEKQEEDQ